MKHITSPISFGLLALGTLFCFAGCPNNSVLKQNSGGDSTEKVSSSTADASTGTSATPPEKKVVVEAAAPPPRPRPVATGGSVEEQFEQAVKLASTQPADAIKLLQEVLSKQPRSYQAWYNIGVLYDRMGNMPSAENGYNKALEIKPDYFPAVINLARLYRRQKRDGQATLLLQRKASQFPKELRYRNALIHTYIRKGQLAQAEQMARAIQKKDEKNAEAIINLGLVWYKQAKYELARTAFNIASETNTKLATPHYYLGQTYTKLKDQVAAIDSLKKALTLQDAYPEAHNLLGVLLIKQGKVKEARGHFEKAVKFMPRYWEARLNLGNALAALQNYKEASAIYQKLIQSFPYKTLAHYHLGILYLDKKVKPQGTRGTSGYVIPAAIQGSKRILKRLDLIAQYNAAVTYIGAYVNRASLPADAPARSYLADAVKKRDKEKKRLQRTIKRELKRYLRKANKRAAPRPAPRPAPAAKPATR